MECRTNCMEEAVVCIVGKVSQQFSEFEDLQKQITLRKVIDEVLYRYDVLSKETALISSDIEEKIHFYMEV